MAEMKEMIFLGVRTNGERGWAGWINVDKEAVQEERFKMSSDLQLGLYNERHKLIELMLYNANVERKRGDKYVFLSVDVLKEVEQMYLSEVLEEMPRLKNKFILGKFECWKNLKKDARKPKLSCQDEELEDVVFNDGIDLGNESEDGDEDLYKDIVMNDKPRELIGEDGSRVKESGKVSQRTNQVALDEDYDDYDMDDDEPEVVFEDVKEEVSDEEVQDEVAAMRERKGRWGISFKDDPDSMYEAYARQMKRHGQEVRPKESFARF